MRISFTSTTDIYTFYWLKLVLKLFWQHILAQQLFVSAVRSESWDQNVKTETN